MVSFGKYTPESPEPPEEGKTPVEYMEKHFDLLTTNSTEEEAKLLQLGYVLGTRSILRLLGEILERYGAGALLSVCGQLEEYTRAKSVEIKIQEFLLSKGLIKQP